MSALLPGLGRGIANDKRQSCVRVSLEELKDQPHTEKAGRARDEDDLTSIHYAAYLERAPGAVLVSRCTGLGSL